MPPVFATSISHGCLSSPISSCRRLAGKSSLQQENAFDLLYASSFFPSPPPFFFLVSSRVYYVLSSHRMMNVAKSNLSETNVSFPKRFFFFFFYEIFFPVSRHRFTTKPCTSPVTKPPVGSHEHSDSCIGRQKQTATEVYTVSRSTDRLTGN